ncbi:sulfurtransferase TusA family protein [uncultured Kocuria sp.]|uniref:sulfurtransferase TusA family protein n=1 Tax=uncultured Kocuria sp. TaxID=259305 RepID=UPI0026344387|nr:sulfurtransferase TusA family protein [uncultured Kocuria sp.]
MAQHVLETDGLVCPFPVVEAKAAMAEMPAGDELVINFDCTQGTEAIPRWAAENGYPVTEFSKRGAAEWSITVQKA